MCEGVYRRKPILFLLGWKQFIFFRHVLKKQFNGSLIKISSLMLFDLFTVFKFQNVILMIF